MTNPQVVFNGKIIPAARLGFAELERAFRFGDSWFETMLLRGKHIRFWQHHYERLLQAAQVWGFDMPDLEPVPELASRLSDMLPDAETYRVRLSLWRTEGRGYAPESGKTAWLLEVFEYVPGEGVQHMGLCTKAVVFSKRAFAGKSGNSAAYVMAAAEARRNGWQHALLLNEQGLLAETDSANIFWKKDAKWYTPALESGCVAGVMRRNVIALLRTEGLFVDDSMLVQPEILQDAEEIFISNALIGIKNIHLFQQTKYPAHAEKIFNRFL